MKCVLQWQTRLPKKIPNQNGEDSRFVKYFLVASKILNDNVYQLNKCTGMTHDMVCVCAV